MIWSIKSPDEIANAAKVIRPNIYAKKAFT